MKKQKTRTVDQALRKCKKDGLFSNFPGREGYGRIYLCDWLQSEQQLKEMFIECEIGDESLFNQMIKEVESISYFEGGRQ